MKRFDYYGLKDSIDAGQQDAASTIKVSAELLNKAIDSGSNILPDKSQLAEEESKNEEDHKQFIEDSKSEEDKKREREEAQKALLEKKEKEIRDRAANMDPLRNMFEDNRILESKTRDDEDVSDVSKNDDEQNNIGVSEVNNENFVIEPGFSNNDIESVTDHKSNVDEQDEDDDDDEDDSDDEEELPNQHDSVKKRMSRPVSDPKNKQTSELRKFPKELAMLIKGQFSGNMDKFTMSQAIAAYVYIKENYPDDVYVPDDIKALAKCYRGNTVSNDDIHMNIATMNNNINKQLKQIEMLLKSDVNSKLMAVLFAVLHAMMENMKASGSFTGDIDFLDFETVDMYTNLEKQVNNKIKSDYARDHRI